MEKMSIDSPFKFQHKIYYFHNKNKSNFYYQYLRITINYYFLEFFLDDLKL